MSQITILPALSSDILSIATLEALTFHDDPFTKIAFGPLRSSPNNISFRAESLSRQPSSKDEWKVVIKAIDDRTPNEIVGAAIWSFVTSRSRGLIEKEDEVEKEKGEGEVNEEEEEEKTIYWGESANRVFCEEVFLWGDRVMLDSCGEGDYAKLHSLVVNPTYQRQGIGTKLLEYGLREVDERGLQCVLGSSKEGLGLYSRFGWVEVERMVIDLSRYEGGEEGSDVHVIMRRPPLGKKI